MANKEQTTVNLTEIAQKIKDDSAPVYGLKNILSAGLYLFEQLSDTEQKAVILKAKNTKRTLREKLIKDVKIERRKRQAYEKLFKQVLAIPNLPDSAKKHIQALQKKTFRELQKSAQSPDLQVAADVG